MRVGRIVVMLGAVMAMLAATPASAQFFFKSRDVSGAPMRGDEPGMGLSLPGATPAELRAGMVWTLRAGLNVAALQCQFEPTLLTVSNYNALLNDHADELAASLDTLGTYFKRVNKTTREGQAALDQFGTRVYSGFVTISAQYSFCQTASSIGREALYAPRGKLGDLAAERLRELHNSLVPWGEQLFPARVFVGRDPVLPRFDEACWTKKDLWDAKKCGTPYPAG